jgi:hypothetical protein
MMRRIALTVDLEPDWGIRGTRAFREVTPRFLRFLEERDIRATFFVCSDLMDASAELVAAIGECNEVASHGRCHRLLGGLSRGEALKEMVESRRRLQETGLPVEGFRAPFFRRAPDHFALVQRAGYAYEASLGTIVPGPLNAWFGSMRCPHDRGGLQEFPTSAMGGGLLPLSLTWLRLCGPAAVWHLPGRPGMVYLHLHEFLSPETARDVPAALRWALTRHCGEPAWGILDRALDALGAEFTTCADILAHLSPF